MTILHFSKVIEKELDIANTFGHMSVDIAIRDMRKRGYVLDSVDDKTVVGMCEVCGRAVVEGEEYQSDEEGVILCKSDSQCLDVKPEKLEDPPNE